ncbi:uroporphyrin-III C-methyltransferase [Thermogymnomonas acidicola]|uniref:uroporphyrinogen-III C-methyltransferase n=1 Tax=Thermogymnomonas acidicola TaxID=399579 RepID=A0AA37BR02_9ARCH|nr:uroporphyrin-III C-methyltransferase [Thermogymnomonas acidicola]
MGRVYIVGAGPGDPGLLTIRAARAIASSSYIVYDRLISREIRETFPAAAKCVCVDELGFMESLASMVDWSRSGTVCRVKAGDPFMFGRGWEEVEYLHRSGVEYEVIPGVSSVNGAACSSMIPLTYRGLSSSFAVTTAVTSGGRGADLRRFGSFDGTLVVLMSGKSVARVSRDLMDGGMDPGMPAAVITRGTEPGQEVHRGTLRTFASTDREYPSPSMLVVGPTVSLWGSLNGVPATDA